MEKGLKYFEEDEEETDPFKLYTDALYESATTSMMYIDDRTKWSKQYVKDKKTDEWHKGRCTTTGKSIIYICPCAHFVYIKRRSLMRMRGKLQEFHDSYDSLMTDMEKLDWSTGRSMFNNISKKISKVEVKKILRTAPPFTYVNNIPYEERRINIEMKSPIRNFDTVKVVENDTVEAKNKRKCKELKKQQKAYNKAMQKSTKHQLRNYKRK